MPKLDESRTEKLTQLARERFDHELSEAELKILRDSASSLDLPFPEKEAMRPPVRPEFLRWLVTDPEASVQIDQKGLRAYGVTVRGHLDLRNCRVPVVLDFRQCSFEGDLNLRSAETKAIFLFDSTFNKEIGADRVNIQGPLFLRKCGVSGEIRLLGATIKGNLDCSGAKLQVKEGNAISADGAEIGGDVFLNKGFECSGLIRLLGAKIVGDLNCSGAKLQVKDGGTLSADGAEIDGRILLNKGFECSGEIRLLGTKIKGGLFCTGAKMQVKEGAAVSADRAEIGGSVYLEKGFESNGAVCLSGAKIGGQLAIVGAKVALIQCQNLRVADDMHWMGIKNPEDAFLDLSGAVVKNLRDDRESWPHQNRLRLDGLVYEELTLHERTTPEHVGDRAYGEELSLKCDERIEWLKLQSPNRQLEPQPWMQLSRHLEAKGDRKDAKHVIFSFRCLRAQQKWWLARRWAISFAWLEEAPLRILYSIAFFFLLGTLIFAGADRSGAMIPTVRVQPNGGVLPVSDHYPPFQPVIYSLENSLPLVKLGMDERWIPDHKHVPQPWFPSQPGLDWLALFNSYWFLAICRWVLILSGWVQATILAAAVADRFKK